VTGDLAFIVTRRRTPWNKGASAHTSPTVLKPRALRVGQPTECGRLPRFE
jgi:hypothetical protein